MKATNKGFGWAMMNLYLTMLNLSIVLGAYLSIHKRIDWGIWFFAALDLMSITAAVKVVTAIQRFGSE